MNFEEIYFDNCYKSLKQLYSELGSTLNRYENNNNDENKNQIEVLYNRIKNGDISDSSSDDDFFDNTPKESNSDKFYNNFINNNINNNMINRYNNGKYLQLYKNYKDNFIF
jgi:hypothetical protein